MSWTVLLAAAAILAGCGGAKVVDPVALGSSYKSLKSADDALAAKKYAEAIPLYDEAIKAGVLQADQLAEVYLRRAVCKIETGDKAGATDDLAKAEQGGAVGDDYQAAQKRLIAKK